MTVKTPRPPPDVQGAVEVGEVASKKRCSSSSTPKKSAEQAKLRMRQGGGHATPRGHGGLPKSDQSEHRDHFGPYTDRQRSKMDAKFSAAIARAHPERRR